MLRIALGRLQDCKRFYDAVALYGGDWPEGRPSCNHAHEGKPRPPSLVRLQESHQSYHRRPHYTSVISDVLAYRALLFNVA